MTQKGLAPILIVLILAFLVGGYLVYQNQTKPTPSPQPTTQPSLSPVTSATSINGQIIYNNSLGTFTYGDATNTKTDQTISIYFLANTANSKKVKIIASVSPYSDFREVYFSPSGEYFTFQLLGPGDVANDYIAKIDGSSTKKLNTPHTYREYSRIIGWLNDNTLLVEETKTPNEPNANITVSYWKIDINNESNRSQVNLQ